MTDTTGPKQAEQWSDFLLDKSVPAEFGTSTLSLEKIETEKPSYPELCHDLKANPVICFSLLTIANSTQRKPEARSKTLEHALSMLGINQTQRILEQYPKAEAGAEFQKFYALLNDSLNCAQLAMDLASTAKVQNNVIQDVFWGTLISFAPNWYLQRFAPQMMQQNDTLSRPNSEDAQQSIFGDTLSNICLSFLNKADAPILACEAHEKPDYISPNRWAVLSTLAKYQDRLKNLKTEAEPNFTKINQLEKQLYRINKKSHAPEFKILRQRPLFWLKLATLVMHYECIGKPTGLLRARRIIAGCLDISLQDAANIISQSYLKISNRYRFPFTSASATRLLMIGEQKDSDKKTSSNPNNAKDMVAGEAESYIPSNVYFEIMRRFKERSNSYEDLHGMMNDALRGVVDGMQLARGCIALYNRDQTRLKTYYFLAKEPKDTLQEFDTLVVNSTIFGLMKEKSSSLWVKPSSPENVTKLIPMNFKQATQSDSGFYMSLFVRGKAIGIFYCDDGKDGVLSEAHYKYFKFLSKTLAKGLAFQATQKK